MSATAGVEARRPEAPGARELAPVAWGSVAVIAAVKVGFQLVTAGLYGPHRDEFYYLDGGYHLAWGYVDHPPLVPVLYRLSAAVFGHTVPALHVLPAFIGAVYVVLGALLAREFGGRRAEQVLAGLIGAFGPLYLTTSHFLSTVSLDLVAWGLASLLVVRMLRTGDPRWWLAIGAVCGVGLLNKWTMAFWILGMVVGLVATPQRRMLASWWAAAGAVIAGACVAPNLVWEAQHGWATLEFLRHIRAGNAPSDRTQFLPLQLVIVTLGGTLVWGTGLYALWRRREWHAQRWLGVGYVTLFVVLFVLGGKGYYLGSWYLPLVALGAVVIERSWSRRAYLALSCVVVVLGIVFAPVFTPVLPESVLTSTNIPNLNKDLGGMLGWHHIVDVVAHSFHELPRTDQARAVVLTQDYSEAGAINFWGPALGLPHAISGHNSYWLWGYGHPRGGPVLAVGIAGSVLRRYWSQVERVATLGADGRPIDPQEHGAPIWICRDQHAPWAVIWPHLRHYD